MQRKQKLWMAKSALIAGVIPVLVYAYSHGPDPGNCGVPGENGTCAQTGCHVGTVNSGQGNVAVTFSNGQTYAPGVTQHLKVTISDPATTQQAWGFQLTARSSTNTQAQAGSFTPSDGNTQVLCTSLTLNGQVAGGAQGCPSFAPLGYVEHTMAGVLKTLGQKGSATYEFDWTPPASSTGDITIYLAGNAGLPAQPFMPGGSHIYTNTYTLTPSAAPPPAGSTVTGVSNAAGGQPGVVPSSFVSIYGSGFTTLDYDDWSKSITNGQLPTQLDGVSVMIGGKPAYIYQISPGQINAQAPDGLTGSVAVTVTNSSGTSPAFATAAQAAAPAFWPWPNSQPVATHNDFTIAAKNGTFSEQTTVPAKPGEVITLWGTGFGQTTPAVAAGQVPPSDGLTKSTGPVSVTLDGIGVQVLGAVLSLYPGDYQVAIQIPSSTTNGDHQLVATIDGASSPAYKLTVQQ